VDTFAASPPSLVVLITGASSGIGRATAGHLHESGYRVFGTCRNPQAETLDGFRLLPLEVTSEESVAACVRAVVEQTGGRIDAVVNNVGTGILGACEESSIGQVQRLFDINLFGAIRVTNAVLPILRAARRGRLLYMSSAGGVVSVPYAGYYCATKHALEAYVEALRLEIEGLGIFASIIAPGTVSTGAGDKALLADRPIEDYAPTRQQAAEEYVQAIREGMEPTNVAKTVHDVLRAANPQPRYTVGLQSWGASMMKAVLPAKMLESGIRRVAKE
jgi:NAD(P)-dependent dehydrogenase (short-subunit alcohol dehydrogenase family)